MPISCSMPARMTQHKTQGARREWSKKNPANDRKFFYTYCNTYALTACVYAAI